MKGIRKILFKFVMGALIVNLLWWTASALLQSRVLVSPLKVYASLPGVLDSGMWSHLLASFLRITGGVLAASVIGVPAGIFMGTCRRFNRIFGAVVYFSYPVPKLALLPVVMLLAGLGEVTKITMIVLIIVFQIMIAIRDAIRNIPEDSRNMMLSLGAGRWQMLRHLIFPAILPDFFTTLHIAVGTAISVLFVTETYGTERGMGFYIVDAWMRISYTEMYAGIVVLSVMGFLMFMLVDVMNFVFCRWKNINQ